MTVSGRSLGRGVGSVWAVLSGTGLSSPCMPEARSPESPGGGDAVGGLWIYPALTDPNTDRYLTLQVAYSYI